MSLVEITWWGHASATIELAGLRVLTDPMFASRLAHLRRIGGPVPAPDCRRADVVVVSHLHRDHLHVPTLLTLPASIRIIAPRGARAALARSQPALADRIDEVVAGDVLTCAGVSVHAVPAFHDGSRGPGSRFGGSALGFVVSGGGRRVWFAGDTGLFDGMSAIGPVDVAVIPVGGWGPTLGPEHLDPVQAAEAVRRVGAADAVPVHYGTLWPAGLRRAHPASYRRSFVEPGARFATALAGIARPHVLSLGEGLCLE